jgi:hypothetical protein
MKKVLFLMFMLFLIVSGTANLKAQVTIGSEQNPQGGAVLDLSQVNDQNLGFLLPRVSLANVIDWQLRGNSTNGVGMLVYNTNPDTAGGNGKAGVYIWTGAGGWEALKSNLADAVQVEAFDLDPSSTDVDLYVGQTASFTVSNFIPSTATYPGVSWTISAGTDKTSITTRSMTTCSLTGLALGQSTLTVRSLDENYQQTVTINVKACTSPPAAPAGITFSKSTGIKLNEEITATATPEVTSGGAVPEIYNWTIPTANFIIRGRTVTRVITLKAIAASTSITNEIKVNAQNTCGTSADYSNTTALSILDCSTVPNQPGGITINPTSVVVGSNFTATIQAVDGATGYTWSVPSGLTIVGGQNTTSVSYQTSTTGTITSGDITVYASNACGPGTSVANEDEIVVTTPPCSDFIIASAVYTHDAFCTTCPSYAVLSTLVDSHAFIRTTNSLCVKNTDSGTGYAWQAAVDACEALNAPVNSGWRLPNAAEFLNLTNFWDNLGFTSFHYWTHTSISEDTGYLYVNADSRVLAYPKTVSTNFGARCVRSL